MIDSPINNEELEVKPEQNSREGWEESFQKMHENGDDKLLIPDVFDDEPSEE